MKRLSTLSLLAAATLLSACAGVMPLDSEQVAKLPVVRYGDTAPAKGEYVLLYPAGAPLPVIASVSGTLLAKTAEARMDVATKRDVYLYKNWLSFDGKTWVVGTDAVSGEFAITLPGEADSKAPGGMTARFDLKQ